MRWSAMAALALLLWGAGGCGDDEGDEVAVVQGDPAPPTPGPPPSDDGPYCGDAICQPELGEDEWWCTDCGFNPLTSGPVDGGYCGDGVCHGAETIRSCLTDCGPRPADPRFKSPKEVLPDPLQGH